MMKPFTLSQTDRGFCEAILKKHSITYYNSTKLFPKDIQTAVFALYAWVRTADEYVDNPKEDPEKTTREFEALYTQTLKKYPGPDRITNIFIKLSRHFKFEERWPIAFLASMKLDLQTNSYYKTREELQCYTFGSAEIIGLMMSRIMGVKKDGEPSAQKLGYWMQLVNFLRDMKEDYDERGRTYIPLSILKKFQLKPDSIFAKNNNPKLLILVKEESKYLLEMLPEIYDSLHYIPKPSRFAVRISVDLYAWTIKKINQNPSIVLTTQVKPTKLIILNIILKNYISNFFSS